MIRKCYRFIKLGILFIIECVGYGIFCVGYGIFMAYCTDNSHTRVDVEYNEYYNYEACSEDEHVSTTYFRNDISPDSTFLKKLDKAIQR